MHYIQAYLRQYLNNSNDLENFNEQTNLDKTVLPISI